MKRPVATAVIAAAAQLSVASGNAMADLTADQTPFHSYRGLWVSRFEYTNNQSGVDAVFANAQVLGITDVMFQVRGAATPLHPQASERQLLRAQGRLV